MMFILGGRLSSIAKYRFPLPERAKNNFTDVHKDEDDDEVSTIGFFLSHHCTTSDWEQMLTTLFSAPYYVKTLVKYQSPWSNSTVEGSGKYL